MQDISNELSQIIQNEKCSSLLAFIMVKEDGLYLPESESCKKSCGRLCNTGDINNNGP